MYRVSLIAAAALFLWFSPALAAGLDGIYGPTPLTAEPHAPPLPTTGVGDEIRPRSFPGQPPTTPHPIDDDYKFGLAENRCILCHSASATAEMTALTHAPRVSASHLVLRDGKTAAEVTPSHRFCTSCHVVQTAVSPPIGNTFPAMNREPR